MKSYPQRKELSELLEGTGVSLAETAIPPDNVLMAGFVICQLCVLISMWSALVYTYQKFVRVAL